MYDAVADPYCYPGTTVLKNIPDLRDQAALDAFETISTAQRSEEPLPFGRLSVRHYRAIHKHLFHDVYPWAGRYRSVRLSKDGSAFCYPEHISCEMRTLFSRLKAKRFLAGLAADMFAAEAAHFLATLNAIHPFREGNGRTQTSFLFVLAIEASHPIELERLDPHTFLNAMVASFFGKEEALVGEIRQMLSDVR
jgi:cell filamentation protein